MNFLGLLVLWAACTSTAVCSVLIGSFQNTIHEVQGTVYVDDSTTIRIENFHYDGLGPDAYMYYYAKGVTPTSTGGGIIIPVPPSAGGASNGRFGSQRFTGQQLILTMPSGTTVHDIGHLAIWCQLASVFFNQPLQFPDSIVFATEPPAVVCSSYSPVMIGSFVTIQHDVSGTVYVDDNTTLRVENFHYDGLGPDAYMYYYAKGVTPTNTGGGIIIPVPPSAGGASNGRFGNQPFSGQQLILTMPSGTTVHDIGHLVVWCQLASAFFNQPLQFPASIQFPCITNNTSTNTTNTSTNTTNTSTNTTNTTTPDNGGGSTVPNCVPLNNQLQLTWSLNTTAASPSATFKLCGCLEPEQYMAFGLSGSTNSINMVNGDVTVAWVDSQPHAEDYFLQGREQCRDGVGVCPDKASALGGTCREDNFNIQHSINNGVTCVTYSRLLDTGDTNCDKTIDMATLDRTYIIWAVGPRGVTAFQHFARSGVSTLPLNLTRDPVNECTAAPSCTSCAAFAPSYINAPHGRTFVAEIGVSGGAQGYQAITGQPGWGIGWYIEGLLVPELTLTRGESYTFRVFGGNDESDRSSYHPFYITDSRSGGRLLNTPEQRMNETVFAGFNESDHAIGVGTFCVFNEGNSSGTIRQQCGTVQQYLGSLVKSCHQNPPVPGEVVFRPDDMTPNLVYYQCATHINLGWKINIIDPPNSTTNPSSTPTPPPDNCVRLHERLELTWTLNTTAPQPVATFTLCGRLGTEQYMAFGLSGREDSSSMVNGDVTVAWVDSAPHAEDYFLQTRNPCTNGAGVCPDAISNAGSTCKQNNFDVRGCVQNGVSCVTYSRHLATGDTNCDKEFDISKLDETYIIWALGPRQTTVNYHSIAYGGYGVPGQPLNLARSPINECAMPQKCPTCGPFTATHINATEGRQFSVNIGPSGGLRGYPAITGKSGGELAFYIDGLLIPELTLTRGERYLFNVYGGSPSNNATLYITDSPTGGRLLMSEEQNRNEQVFAGLDEVNIRSTYCRYIESNSSATILQQCGTLQQYLNSLERKCQQTPPIPTLVVFVPDNNTPDTVYYQSANRENFGWRINVVGTTSGSATVLMQSWVTLAAVITTVTALLVHL